jgi:hypothetical protein
MLVMATGMNHSGAAWVFAVCKKLFEAAGQDHRLIRSHHCNGNELRTIIGSEQKVRFVHTLRDPVEVCIAALQANEAPIDATLAAIERSIEFLTEQRRTAPVFLIPYVMVQRSPERLALHIDEFLGTAVAGREIRSVRLACEGEREPEKIENLAKHIDRPEQRTALPWQGLISDERYARARRIVDANRWLFDEYMAVTV